MGPSGHRRQARPVHGRWRAASGALVLVAVAVLGAILVAEWREPDSVPVATESHHDVCLALVVVRDTLLRERVPPPFPTPEQVQAVAEINADLAYMRGRLFELDGIRQLRCQEGS